MNMNTYIVACLVYYLFAYTYYIIISHGLGNKATYLQMRRFIPCAILAVLPVATANIFPITQQCLIEEGPPQF